MSRCWILSPPPSIKRYSYLVEGTGKQMLSFGLQRLETPLLGKLGIGWHFHPYHYCLLAMLERYIMWLQERDGLGDVMAEARDKKSNRKLEEAYQTLYTHGLRVSKGATPTIAAKQVQRRLTSKEIKLKTKEANVAGLQLADLLANPARRQLLCIRDRTEMKPGFGRNIVDILVESKYRRSQDKRRQVRGYGVKILP